MRITEILRLVWVNIIQNKTKVLLTSLGIIVGSATIVLVIAIGQGGQADVADQFKNLNAGAIDVKSIDAQTAQMEMMPDLGGGAPPDGGVFSGGGGGSGGGSISRGGSSSGNKSGSSSRKNSTRNTRVRLTESDVADISQLVSGLEEVTILVNGTTTVFGGDLEEEKASTTVVGVLQNYQQVSNLSTMYGSFITDEDNNNSNYVAVLGYSLAKEIFTLPAYAYGDFITIDGKNYEIVGVLQEMGSVSSGISSDNAIYIPYNTGIKYIFGSQTEPTITAVAKEVSDVDAAIENIKAVLTENYPKGNFSVTDAGSAMDAATSSANTLAMLLFAVATIVFVVGGIGIMNVLFVSVQERTPEIGIFKAIGCPSGSILLEFLMEAIFMGLAGGILGVVLSFGIIPLIEMFGMRLETSLMGYVLALIFALFTATLFGFYPAYKASK
ncbi:MAG TPA: ABC transporter permease, partial [Clostridia bacterium]|nr:ABC transporter permease [Clostridia bacterium]